MKNILFILIIGFFSSLNIVHAQPTTILDFPWPCDGDLVVEYEVNGVAAECVRVEGEEDTTICTAYTDLERFGKDPTVVIASSKRDIEPSNLREFKIKVTRIPSTSPEEPRARFPDKLLLVDLKTMDSGADEPAPASNMIEHYKQTEIGFDMAKGTIKRGTHKGFGFIETADTVTASPQIVGVHTGLDAQCSDYID